jgi:hypothetical protein
MVARTIGQIHALRPAGPLGGDELIEIEQDGVGKADKLDNIIGRAIGTAAPNAAYNSLDAALGTNLTAGTFQVAGRHAPGDGGDGSVQVYPSAASLPAGIPASSVFNLVGGRKARYVEKSIRPERMSSFLNYNQDMQQVFLEMRDELVWRGGGRVDFEDKEYKVYTVNPTPGLKAPVLDLHDVKTVRINMNGGKINSPVNFGLGIIIPVFGLEGATDVTVDSFNIEQSAYQETNGTYGMIAFYIRNATVGLEFTGFCRQNWGLKCVHAVRENAWGHAYSAQNRSRICHFDKFEISNVRYPLSCAKNMDGLTGGILRTHHAERSYFVYNVHNHKIDKIISSDRNASLGDADDILVKAYATVGESDFENSTTGIDVTYFYNAAFDTAASGQFCALAIAQEASNGPGGWASGKLSDIRLKLGCSVNQSGHHPAMGIYTARNDYQGGYDNSTGHAGHVWEDIIVEPTFNTPFTSGSAGYMFQPTQGTYTDDIIRNVITQNGTIDFSMPWQVDGSVVDANLVFKNFLSNGDLNVGTPPLHVLDVSEGVDTANIKSSDMTFFSGNDGGHGYTRLPRGAIRQQVWVDMGAGAGTTAPINWPIPFRAAGGYIPAVSVAVVSGGAAGDSPPRINAGAASFTITRFDGAAVRYCVTAEGPV